MQIKPPTPAPAIGPPGYPPPIMNRPYPATGTVVFINRQEGWIEINHDEIKGFDAGDADGILGEGQIFV